MSTITIELVEKHFGEILDQVGYDSYVPWQQFTKNSTKVVNAIDQLAKSLAIFRQMQHKKFIQTMKKLKGLDIPDTIQSVRNKKLPKQVLKPILPRFKFNQGKIQLIDTKENLKIQALKQYEAFKVCNQQLVAQVDKYIQFFTAKAIESGYQQPLPVPQLKMLKSTVQFKFDHSKIKDLCKQIKLSFLPLTKLISIQTYAQLINKTFDLSEPHYVDLTLNARKQQRKHHANPQKYFKIMSDYMNNSEALIFQSQKALYDGLGLDQKQLDLNQHSLVQRGFGQQMMMIQGQIRSKLKQSIKSTKQVPSQKVVQVIKFQIKMINQKKGQIKKIFGGLQKTIQSAQTIPVLLSLVLNDYIFDAYGFQQQDFMKNVNGMQIYSNPVLAETFRQMEMAVISLMQSLQIIPQDISDMMLGGGGFDMNAMMAEMNNMGGNMNLSGNNSSSNPMELLQAQQLAQMQQMFKNMQNNSKKGPK